MSVRECFGEVWGVFGGDVRKGVWTCLDSDRFVDTVVLCRAVRGLKTLKESSKKNIYKPITTYKQTRFLFFGEL